MNGPDLETRIRSYYRTCAPTDSGRLMLASRALLYDARRPRSRFGLWGGLKTAGTVAAVAVLVAVLALPRFAALVGPAAVATFDPAAASNASVDQAGLMRSGGIWAVQGSYLLTSTDAGASWRAGDFPTAAGAVFVLDPEHAWALAGDGTWCNGGCRLVVTRTVDRGRSWSQSTVTSDVPCDRATVSFVDAERGFVMCAKYAQPASTGPSGVVPATVGSGTLLRTTDGGASWVVASHADGLGADFTASDANTLWSAEDSASSSFDGVALFLSRDAGTTWSAVALPELGSLPVGPGPVGATTGNAADTCGGPAFVDASHGSFAVESHPIGDPWSPTIWFYRTSDAGRSWNLVKKAVHIATGNDPLAMVGDRWAIVGTNSLTGLTTSDDFGANWTDVPGDGLPGQSLVRPLFAWVDFTDSAHGAALSNVSIGDSSFVALMLSSDGGRSWSPANFGDARANVAANPALDAGAAQSVVDQFEKMARPDPRADYAASDLERAWQLLSPYSQHLVGSVSAFKSAEGALTTWTAADQVGQATRGADTLSRANLGAGVWDDLNSHADVSRAYVVQATPADASQAAQTFVAAPLIGTGEWRVWVVTMP
jgi:hypothetical protein